MTRPLADYADDIISRRANSGVTSALGVVCDGDMVVERYGVIPANPLRPEIAVRDDTPLLSWSVAKSVVHALVGALVADGFIDIHDRVELGRSDTSITWLDLLEMRSGLAFVEEYEPDQPSDCIEMLFSGEDASGVADMGAFAAAQPVVAPAGQVWNYSSGSTNIICRAIGDVLAGALDDVGADERRSAVERYLYERIIVPAGMTEWSARFDRSGTLIGSSFMWAPLRSWCAFGELYRRGGDGGAGDTVLPLEWVKSAGVTVAHDPDGAGPEGFGYGRHWWTWPHRPGVFAAHGYDGQFVVVWPQAKVTLAHFGVTPREHAPALIVQLDQLLDAVVAS